MASNSEIEELGVKAVIDWEKAKGRGKHERVNKCGYDLKTSNDSEERHIEIKSTSKDRFTWRWLEQLEYDQFQNDEKFWLYLVTDVEGTPKVIPYSREKLKARFDEEIRHYVFVFPKSDF
jgi:Domain of unknown function (DUF3883)